MTSDTKTINLVIRLFCLGLLFFWCFLLIRPFVTVLLWGGILAIAWFPIFLWLKSLLGGRANLAAVLRTLLCIGIIVGPVSAIAAILAGNLRTLAEHLATGGLVVPPPPASVAGWPVIGERLVTLWGQASANIGEFAGRFEPQLQQLAKTSLSIAASTGVTVLKFLVSIIIAGALTLDARNQSHWLTRFSERLAPGRGLALLKLSTTTVRNVSRGILGIAAIQSLLVGIGFVVAGIPAAGVLTLLCLLLAIIQIGPGLVVIPTLIFAWTTMEPSRALLLTLWMIPAMLVDNFLKPVLMARGLPVPMVVILVGVFGGVVAYGIIGLFVGPVLLGLAYELIRVWIGEDPVVAVEAIDPPEQP
jgi:predicted PurR-regulated permease PerM